MSLAIAGYTILKLHPYALGSNFPPQKLASSDEEQLPREPHKAQFISDKYTQRSNVNGCLRSRILLMSEALYLQQNDFISRVTRQLLDSQGKETPPHLVGENFEEE